MKLPISSWIAKIKGISEDNHDKREVHVKLLVSFIRELRLITTQENASQKLIAVGFVFLSAAVLLTLPALLTALLITP